MVGTREYSSLGRPYVTSAKVLYIYIRGNRNGRAINFDREVDYS